MFQALKDEYARLGSALAGAESLADVQAAVTAIREWDLRCDRASQARYQESRAAGENRPADARSFNTWRSGQRAFWGRYVFTRLKWARAEARGPAAVKHLEVDERIEDIRLARRQLCDPDRVTREAAHEALQWYRKNPVEAP